jgi:hypothetical protein
METRRSTVVLLGGILSFGVVLAGGCAGDRGGGQVATGDLASTTTIAGTTGQQGTTTAATSKGSAGTTAAGRAAGTSSATGGTTASTRRRSTATTKRSATSSSRRPVTTKPTATTKPAVKLKLTLQIVNDGNVAGVVAVTPGGTCRSVCTFTYSKATTIELAAIDGTIEEHQSWSTSGGQTTCDGQQGSCAFELTETTTVKAFFKEQQEG